MQDKSKAEAEAVAEIVAKGVTSETITIPSEHGAGDDAASVVLVPAGKSAMPFEKFRAPLRAAPRRRTGESRVDDLLSFVKIVNRFKDEDSAVFADKMESKVLAVFNYHRAGGEGAPRFGDHRACYNFPLSEEWKAWTAKNDRRMAQADFAAFIEDRIADVVAYDPAPAADGEESTVAKLARTLGGDFAAPNRLFELSRGLAVREGAKVESFTNLTTGESRLQFVTEHTDADGKPLLVPSLFLLQIPVFEAGALYNLAARLRYRVRAGSIEWFYTLYRPDVVFNHAFDEACGAVRDATALPVYLGVPENPAS